MTTQDKAWARANKTFIVQALLRSSLKSGNTKGGSIIVPLASCLTRLELTVWQVTSDKFCFYLQNSIIQTSQTGGQCYSDTSTFSIPCLNHKNIFKIQATGITMSNTKLNIFNLFQVLKKWNWNWNSAVSAQGQRKKVVVSRTLKFGWQAWKKKWNKETKVSKN